MLRWKIRILKLHLFKKGTIFHVLSRLSVVLKINFSLRLENSLKLKESSSPSVIESISNYQVTDCWLKKNWSPCKEREAMSYGPMDYTVHGILQARILEWAAFPSPGDLPNPGSNPCLPHCRGILYQLSHQGSPRILEWVAYSFSRRSSWPRNWTGVSCIISGFFTSWVTREAQWLS